MAENQPPFHFSAIPPARMHARPHCAILMPTTVERARSKMPWSSSKTVTRGDPAVPSYYCGGTPGLCVPGALRAPQPTALPLYTLRMAYTESLFPGNSCEIPPKQCKRAARRVWPRGPNGENNVSVWGFRELGRAHVPVRDGARRVQSHHR